MDNIFVTAKGRVLTRVGVRTWQDLEGVRCGANARTGHPRDFFGNMAGVGFRSQADFANWLRKLLEE